MSERLQKETRPRKGRGIGKALTVMALLAVGVVIDAHEDGGLIPSPRDTFDGRNISLPGGRIIDNSDTDNHPAYSQELADDRNLLRSIPKAEYFSFTRPWEFSRSPRAASDEGLRKITITEDKDKKDETVCELVRANKSIGEDETLYAWTQYADGLGNPLDKNLSVHILDNLISFCVDKTTFDTVPEKPMIVFDIKEN